jgi:L-asparaginase II
MSHHPLGVPGVVELAVLERSGMIESRHLGAAVVMGPDGSALGVYGDPEALVYPRSTLKLIQAITVLRSGVDLEGEQLVLASASHIGTAGHVRVVRAMLDRAGLGEEALQCPPDWPGDTSTRRSATIAERITMNCSGKHAAFLLACVENGWPIESYLDPQHPLQLLIRDAVEHYTGEPVRHTGTDGCGAPVHAVTLLGLATAIGRISGASEDFDPPATRLAAAIRANPWALDTPAVATVIGELGLVAKSGAEGVFVAGSPDGTAVALKILDGSQRASIPVALSLLVGVGAIDADDAARVVATTAEQVLGGGLPVGEFYSTV